MRQIVIIALLAATSAQLGLAQTTSTAAVEPAPGASAPPEDSVAIHAGSQAFVAAFNARDAKAVAALWTEQGEYMDGSGRKFSGRAEIEAGYAEFFRDNPEAKIQIAIDSLRFPSGVTAIEEGRAVVTLSTESYSQYTAIHAKVGGKWLMASVRDASLEASPENESIADLEWLIGTWIAEEHGNQVKSVCRWVANRSFVERRYTTTGVDGTRTSGIQLIGWNPDGGHVQSWDFSPGGGHAVGVWSPTDQGWASEVHGVSGDGTRSMSVNVLRRLDDNAYVWQSVQRSYGNMPLPDTDEVVLKRQPTDR